MGTTRIVTKKWTMSRYGTSEPDEVTEVIETWEDTPPVDSPKVDSPKVTVNSKFLSVDEVAGDLDKLVDQANNIFKTLSAKLDKLGKL